MSPNCGINYKEFQIHMHNLCGFHRKRFVCQFWCHLLILNFLTSPIDHGQLTLCINRTLCISCYILFLRMREGYEGGSGSKFEIVDSYACSSVPNASSIFGLHSKTCIIIKCAIFRSLSDDDASSIVYHAIQQSCNFFSLSLVRYTLYD